MSGLILILPSLAMSVISVRLVLVYIRDLRGYLTQKAAPLAANVLVGNFLGV